MVTLVRQPEGSNLCAHACLAMVLGISLQDACDHMGHKRKTYTRELVNALGPAAGSKRLIVAKKLEQIPETAILRIKWNDHVTGHFSLRVGPCVYDPLFQSRVTVDTWLALVRTDGARLTSFLPIRMP